MPIVLFNTQKIRDVRPEKFFSAVANLDRWQVVGNLRKLRKRVSRKSTQLSGPATVNAFNYFDLNYIRKFVQTYQFLKSRCDERNRLRECEMYLIKV